MSVAAEELPSEAWVKWEGHTIGGRYPLRRLLAASDHSAVFLTEHLAQALPNAALKLVPLIPTLADTQLQHWRAAANLSHPNLCRLLDSGRCQLGDSQFLYVVMEFAEQRLDQLLRHRAMTEAEAREMLLASLDALGFLHSLNLVQGRFSPANVLVVGDRLKLAADTIRPAGGANTGMGASTPYDPPETRDGSFGTAGDIWALGVTTFEALARRSPWSSEQAGGFPADFPPDLAEIVRRCLSRDPAARPRARAIESWLTGKAVPPPLPAAPAARRPTDSSPSPARRDSPARSAVTPPAPDTAKAATTAPMRAGSAATSAPARDGESAASKALAPGLESAAVAAPRPRPEPADAVNIEKHPPTRLVMRAVLREAAPVPQEPPPQRSFLPVIGVVTALALCWLGAHELRLHWLHGAHAARSGSLAGPVAASSQPTPPSAQSVTAAETASGAAAAPRAGSVQQGTAAAGVVHQDIPQPSAASRATIRGHIKVAVRVSIDSTGKVVGDGLVEPGPSRYFARLASQSARRWQFAPAPGIARRQHLLRFEFGRDGATARLLN